MSNEFFLFMLFRGHHEGKKSHLFGDIKLHFQPCLLLCSSADEEEEQGEGGETVLHKQHLTVQMFSGALITTKPNYYFSFLLCGPY